MDFDDEWDLNDYLHLPLDPKEVRKLWGKHGHCVYCFDLNCQNDDCQMISCKSCRAKFHQCKADDHGNICSMAWVPCLNSEYGCKEVIRRDHRGSHLASCCASVVVCNLQWNREIIGKQAKKRMKQVARGFKKQMLLRKLKEIEEGELDVFAALMDQNEIMKSYCMTRKSRVQQRTPCTPANPILPLRFYNEMSSFVDENSSDDEIFKEEEKRMKTKQPFAGCYICKLEPGMQHLHVLGNLLNPVSELEINGKNDKKDLDEILQIVVPEFYIKRNLFVKLSEERMVDHHRKAFQYTWTREMHTFTCTEVMRRDEIKNHWNYHNTILQQVDGRIVKRCPGFLNGCDFFIQQMIPKIGGRIKFQDDIQKFLFEPFYGEAYENSGKKLPSDFGDFKIPHVLDILLPFLDTTSIRTLSSSNSTLNYVIRSLMKSRTMILLNWKKVGTRKWEISGKMTSFSNLPSVMELIPNVKANSEMIQHTANCTYCERLNHGRNPELIEKFVNLAVKPVNLPMRID